jgi:hypothetical protein
LRRLDHRLLFLHHRLADALTFVRANLHRIRKAHGAGEHCRPDLDRVQGSAHGRRNVLRLDARIDRDASTLIYDRSVHYDRLADQNVELALFDDHLAYARSDEIAVANKHPDLGFCSTSTRISSGARAAQPT